MLKQDGVRFPRGAKASGMDPMHKPSLARAVQKQARGSSLSLHLRLSGLEISLGGEASRQPDIRAFRHYYDIVCKP